MLRASLFVAIFFFIGFSLADFPSITITSPTAQNSYTTGDTINIGWTSTVLCPTEGVSVHLFDYEDNQYVLAENIFNNKTFAWTIPYVYGEDTLRTGRYQIGVMWDADSSVFHLSRWFVINSVKPSLRITSPTAATDINGGTMLSINWESTGIPATEQVHFALAQGEEVLELVSVANTGSYSWNVPTWIKPSHKYIIVAATDGAFALSRKFVIRQTDFIGARVTAPAAGASLNAGATTTISWTSTLLPATEMVSLSLVDPDGNTYSIIQSTPNSGSYQWSIPQSYKSSQLYQIKLTWVPVDSAGFTYNIVTYSRRFTINTPFPTITITSPTAATSLTPQETLQVRWTSSLPAAAMVFVTIMRGEDTIDSTSTANDGVYDFVLPYYLKPSNKYSVEISWVPCANSYCNSISQSSRYFTVLRTVFSSLSISQPTMTTVVRSRDPINSMWTNTGIPASAELGVAFLYNGDILGETAEILNTGSYLSQVPPSIETGHLYQVALEGADSMAYSRKFIVEQTESSITILEPNRTSVWNTLDVASVRWSTVGINANESMTITILDNGSPLTSFSTLNTGLWRDLVPQFLRDGHKYTVQISLDGFACSQCSAISATSRKFTILQKAGDCAAALEFSQPPPEPVPSATLPPGPITIDVSGSIIVVQPTFPPTQVGPITIDVSGSIIVVQPTFPPTQEPGPGPEISSQVKVVAFAWLVILCFFLLF